jgi:hypothetical protein
MEIGPSELLALISTVGGGLSEMVSVQEFVVVAAGEPFTEME